MMSKVKDHGHDLDPSKKKNKWGLTPQEEAFCQAYLIDFNIAKAERLSGLKPGSGQGFMRKDKVRRRIHQIRLETGRAFDVTREALLQELMKIVYTDPSSAFIEGTNRYKNPSEWGEDLKASISEIELDLIGSVKKVKRYDKTKAIELLSKMLGYNMPEIVLNKNLNLNSDTSSMNKEEVLAISKLLEENL